MKKGLVVLAFVSIALAASNASVANHHPLAHQYKVYEYQQALDVAKQHPDKHVLVYFTDSKT